jgi:hypothetical protein
LILRELDRSVGDCRVRRNGDIEKPQTNERPRLGWTVDSQFEIRAAVVHQPHVGVEEFFHIVVRSSDGARDYGCANMG